MIEREAASSADPRDVRVVAKGGAVQVAGQFTQGIVAFAFVAIVVRLLGTAEYGLFRQVAQILAIAAQVGLAGFNYSAMRFISKARASGDPGGVRGAPGPQPWARYLPPSSSSWLCRSARTASLRGSPKARRLAPNSRGCSVSVRCSFLCSL